MHFVQHRIRFRCYTVFLFFHFLRYFLHRLLFFPYKFSHFIFAHCEELSPFILSDLYYFIGFSSSVAHFRRTVRWIRYTVQVPQVVVMCGGNAIQLNSHFIIIFNSVTEKQTIVCSLFCSTSASIIMNKN